MVAPITGTIEMILSSVASSELVSAIATDVAPLPTVILLES